MRDMARTQNAKVIFMPTETSAVLASVGAFKEVFSETGEAGVLAVEWPDRWSHPPAGSVRVSIARLDDQRREIAIAL